MQSWPCAAVPDADLSSRTTMRVGGRARWLLEPTTPEELRAAIAAVREAALPLRLLGGGANLIVDDGTWEGVVVTTDRIKRLFRPEPADSVSAHDALTMEPRIAPAPRDQGLRFVAWSGITLPKLVSSAAALGWRGVEGLAGVPGQIGGGIAMNAGGKWGEMWDVVERVLVIDEEARFVELPRAECTPRYRNGGLGERIVAAAVLRFTLAEVHDVQQRGRTFLQEKNKAQPVTAWSAGCVFKNPPAETSGGRSAGKLIEDAGLKGHVIGDAIVSPLHGNFIVNRGKATARDVFALIEHAQRVVRDRFDVGLELEAKVWRA